MAQNDKEDAVGRSDSGAGLSLLSCPHCGSMNLRGPYCNEYCGDNYAPEWWIECNECPAYMCTQGSEILVLIKAWNRRA